MTWSKQFPNAYVGDAYERMFLNAARGDGSLFVSEKELVEAWRIFTPLLHEIDAQKPEPVPYPFGSLYPPGFDTWSSDHGVLQKSNWVVELCNASPEELTALFNSLDTDATGTLDAAQLTGLAKAVWARAHPDSGREPTDKKAETIRSRLDVSGDGTLALAAFLSAAESMKSPASVGEDEIAGFQDDLRASMKD